MKLYKKIALALELYNNLEKDDLRNYYYNQLDFICENLLPEDTILSLKESQKEKLVFYTYYYPWYEAKITITPSLLKDIEITIERIEGDPKMFYETKESLTKAFYLSLLKKLS